MDWHEGVARGKICLEMEYRVNDGFGSSYKYGVSSKKPVCFVKRELETIIFFLYIYSATPADLPPVLDSFVVRESYFP